MRTRLPIWLLMLVLIMALVQPAGQAKQPTAPPDPTPMGGGEVSILGSSAPPGNPGTWYVGATPPNVDYTKPVLLFVHGKGGSAQVWWGPTVYHGNNDMYQYAYNNGYRTAFVDMHHDRSMWENGQMLNQQIDAVRNYFGVSKVTIIAHSKGGVDSDAALFHYGAAGKVSRVITLGTPHWGTPIADMAYSSWTWWIAALMGERNDATYVMQTGYMNYFRSITGSSAPFFTISGYKCGPVFSALWYGCMAISGEDDGVVPVWSARRPSSTHLREGHWDHDEIRMGSRTWSSFSSVIRTAQLNSAVAMEGPLLAAAPGAMSDVGRGQSGAPAAPGNLILRGGETRGQAMGDAFPIESGVRQASFTFLASAPDFSATLIGPDGSRHALVTTGQTPSEDVFGGAWMAAVQVDNPAAGSWQIETTAAHAGWFMMASLDSDLAATLDVGADVGTPGAQRALAVGFGQGRAPANSRAEAAISLNGGQPYARQALTRAGQSHRATLAIPPGLTGIHNVTVTVTGTLDDGTAFERTVVSSFAAVPPGQRGIWKGR